MSGRLSRAIVVLALAALSAQSVGCAPIPRPAVMAEADRVRQSPAAQQAKRDAPTAFAHAEKLQRQAEEAFESDDLAAAEILSERAIAAYSHAHALARVARAEQQAGAKAAELTASRADLAAVEADQTRVTAEIEALDQRIRVTRDAQPIVPSRAADPAREKARSEAARALAVEARMLCTAARLLAASSPPATAPTGEAAAPAAEARPTDGLDAAEAAVTSLFDDLAAAAPAPIDRASRARAGCLAVLTAMRRQGTPVTRAPGAGDALLSSLSATGGLAPSRDDRGVSVTLRDLFDGKTSSKLSKGGQAKLRALGSVAASNTAFPVAVIVHQEGDGAKETAVSKARAEAVVAQLKGERAPNVAAVLAGAGAPVVDPRGKDRARNARVEIVFVTPESL